MFSGQTLSPGSSSGKYKYRGRKCVFVSTFAWQMTFEFMRCHVQHRVDGYVLRHRGVPNVQLSGERKIIQLGIYVWIYDRANNSGRVHKRFGLAPRMSIFRNPFVRVTMRSRRFSSRCVACSCEAATYRTRAYCSVYGVNTSLFELRIKRHLYKGLWLLFIYSDYAGSLVYAQLK